MSKTLDFSAFWEYYIEKVVESGGINHTCGVKWRIFERRKRVMFMGEYNHTIDTKGRLIVPSKFREQLGNEFVVTKGLDGCLFAFSKEYGIL